VPPAPLACPQRRLAPVIPAPARSHLIFFVTLSTCLLLRPHGRSLELNVVAPPGERPQPTTHKAGVARHPPALGGLVVAAGHRHHPQQVLFFPQCCVRQERSKLAPPLLVHAASHRAVTLLSGPSCQLAGMFSPSRSVLNVARAPWNNILASPAPVPFLPLGDVNPGPVPSR
jgi:hypothetical protein